MRRQTVSFLNCFNTLSEAEYFSGHLIEPCVIIHLYAMQELQLFAVCTKGSLDVINEALTDETKARRK